MAAITVFRSGVACTLVATLLVILAFSTPYWLECDVDKVPQVRYYNLGLWNICLKEMQDPYYLYDVVFDGCRYILIEDLWILRDQLLEPSFFVAVQTLYTLSFVLVLVGTILVVMYSLCCAPEYYKLLFLISLDLLVAAILGTMAVIIFGARGDGRDWMPDPDHNFLSWSFGLAVVGVYFLWVASLLFLIQAKRIRKEEERQEHDMYGGPGHSKA